MTKHYPKFDMKRSLILILFLSLIFSATVFAQKGAGHRQKWMKEMQQAKIEFMTKELDIAEQQKARFAESSIAMPRILNTRKPPKPCLNSNQGKAPLKRNITPYSSNSSPRSSCLNSIRPNASG